MGATESKDVSITRQGSNSVLNHDWSLSDYEKLISNSPGYSVTRDIVALGTNQKHEFTLCLYPGGYNERTKDFLAVCLKRKSDKEVSVRFTCSLLYKATNTTQGKNKEICRASAKKNLALETVVGWTTFCRRCFIPDKKLSYSDLILQCNIEIFSTVLTTDEDDEAISFKMLSDDYQKLLNSGSFGDFVFHVDGERIGVHKSILSARSPVFKAMINCPLLKQQREIITDISHQTMRILMKFVYTGRVDFLDVPTAMEVYYASDKYEIFFLRNACSEILVNNLCISNVIKILLLAYRHGDSELEKQCLSFMDKNLREIKGRDEWIKLMQQYPKLADKALFFRETPVPSSF